MPTVFVKIFRLVFLGRFASKVLRSGRSDFYGVSHDMATSSIARRSPPVTEKSIEVVKFACVRRLGFIMMPQGTSHVLKVLSRRHATTSGDSNSRTRRFAHMCVYSCRKWFLQAIHTTLCPIRHTVRQDRTAGEVMLYWVSV